MNKQQLLESLGFQSVDNALGKDPLGVTFANRITIHAASARALGKPSYVIFFFNRETKHVIIAKVKNDSIPGTFDFRSRYKYGTDGVAVEHADLCREIFDLMEWDKKRRYIVSADLISTVEGPALDCDLSRAKIYVPPTKPQLTVSS